MFINGSLDEVAKNYMVLERKPPTKASEAFFVEIGRAMDKFLLESDITEEMFKQSYSR